MFKKSKGLGLGVAVVSMAFFATSPANAQNLTDLVPLVPRIDTTDANGVDIPSGVFRFSEELIASGEGLTLSLSFPIHLLC
jgi:hypothetical protein